jgi:tight adherence protein B
MSPVVLILLIVILVVGFGVFAYVMLNNGSAQKDRARAIITGQHVEKSAKDKVDPQDRRRAEIARKLRAQDGDDDENGMKKKKATLREKIMQAGLDITVKQYFIYSAILGFVLSALTIYLNMMPLMTIFAAIIGFFGIPRFILKRKTKRRQKKFMDEFADALEAMVRLLKAGMPVSEAVKMVSREYTGPVGEEMAKIYDTQRIGVPLHEAALDAIKRMPLPEMKMFATGLSIQAQTGSSLSEVLSNLASLIRSRYKLARKVKALSSEAKAGAMIIGSMPLLVSFGIYVFKPEHIQLLFDTAQGKVMLGGALFWMSCGIFIMKAMINFKV